MGKADVHSLFLVLVLFKQFLSLSINLALVLELGISFGQLATNTEVDFLLKKSPPA